MPGFLVKYPTCREGGADTAECDANLNVNLKGKQGMATKIRTAAGIAAVVAALAFAPAQAFEKHMMRIPDSLKPQEGTAGVFVPAKDPTAVALPLKNGKHVVIWNQSPFKSPPKGDVMGASVAPNVADRNIVSVIRAAMKKCPAICINIGGSTFFAYYCSGCKAYEGLLVTKGAAFTVSVFLPQGRAFDGEVRGILEKVEFLPPPGYGVDSALKLYGERGTAAAGERYAALKKMVEARPEVWELVAALKAASGDHADTVAWCDKQLKRLNPAVFDPKALTKNSVRAFDSGGKEEIDAAMELAGAAGKTKKTSAKVPGTVAVAATPAGGRTSPSAAEPKPAEVAAKKPKVAVKPGPGEMTYKGRKWRYEINWNCTRVWLMKNPLDDYSGTVEFPATLGGLPLKEIDWELFMDRKEMKGVVLPEGLEKIGNKAFENCTGLKEAVLREGLETIGNSAFVECTSLEKVTLPKSLKALEHGAFFLCEKLTGDFDLSRLEKIEGWLFKGCPRIRSVILPEGLTFLDNNMFEACSNLTKVTIPRSVKFIDSSVFGDCVSFKGEMVIPEGVTNIGYGAFRNCSGLTSFKIPQSVRKFGDSVFQGCSGVTRFDVPKDLDRISEFMFAETGLTAFDFPAGVKKIGAAAFSDCKSLKGVSLPQGLEKLENWAFQKSGIESIDVPSGVKEIEPYAFAQCEGLKTVALHEGLKKICKGVFKECTALEEITVPASVESIGVEAFEGCTKLKKVVFLGQKPKIAKGTFKGCAPDVEKLEP